VLKNIADVSKREVSLSYREIIIYPCFFRKMQAIFYISSSHHDSKYVYAHLGMALPVLCLPLSGSDCTVASCTSAAAIADW
jgi:hypothetical protein